MSGAEHESADRVTKAQQAVLTRETEIGDLRWLMGDPRGRRVMWRLLEGSGIYRSSFSTDPLVMAFAEGERNRGLRLLDEITQHCPKNLIEMQKEARTNERRKAS